MIAHSECLGSESGSLPAVGPGEWLAGPSRAGPDDPGGRLKAGWKPAPRRSWTQTK